jgi:hypothetical protein
MMNSILRVFHALLFALATTGLCFASEELICPDRVHLASGTVVPEDVPPGYKPFVSSSMVRLTGVTVFDGRPEEGAVLKPSSFSPSGESIKWIFDGTNEKEIWIACDYANGLIRLVRQIGESTASCMATVKTTKPQKTLDAKFTCK